MAGRRPLPYSKLIATSGPITIRPYKYSDYKSFIKSLSQRLPNQNQYDVIFANELNPSLAAFKEKVDRNRKLGKMKVHFILGVFSTKTNKYLGQVDLFMINKQLRWFNLGYQILNQHWGKGYATRAGKVALKMAFTNLNIHRVECGCELENDASIKVAKNLGMDREGIRKRFFHEDLNVNMLIFGANAIDNES